MLCGRRRASELALEPLQHIQDDRRELSAVRPDNQGAIALLNLVLESGAPILLACLEDIEGVAHASRDARWVLLQEVPHRIELARLGPRRHRAVLRGWNGEACRSLAVEVLGALERNHGVGAQ